MFYIYSDITIASDFTSDEMANAVAAALRIPKFVLSDRYDGDEVFVTQCFGLEFELTQDNRPAKTFHLSVNSETGEVEYDASEKEYDGSSYILFLLRQSGIDAERRSDDLLYG